MSSFASDRHDVPAVKLILGEKTGLKAFVVSELSPETTIIPANEILQPDVALCSTSKVSLPPMYSPSGGVVCLVGPPGTPIIIRNTVTGAVTCTVPCTDAQSAEFSPLGTYLVTWSRFQKGTEGAAHQGNLRVWSLATGELVAHYSSKVMKKELIQWTTDESVCLRIVTNEVHIMDGRNLPGGIINKIFHKGITQFRASSSGRCVNVGVFSPSHGGNAAQVVLYQYCMAAASSPMSAASNAGTVSGNLSSRTVFSANEATFSWDVTGTILLVHTHADVDSSNTSYYGATGIYMLTIDGKTSIMVSQSKTGPVYDVKWSPTGRNFVVCAGNMPSSTTLYNTSGEAVYEFGSAHRNTISWAPHGRFLCVAGFGNLAGEMDFYEIVVGKKVKKIGSNTAHCSVEYGWSPDSRCFATATLAPRMNVDNGFKIFKYNGIGPIATYACPEPTAIGGNGNGSSFSWQSASHGVYSDRPRSPQRAVPLTVKGGGSSSASGAALAVDANAAAKAAVAAAPYRPRGSTGFLAESMKRSAGPVGKVGVPGATKAATKSAVVAAPVRVIPGMSPAAAAAQQKTANKNASKAGGVSISGPKGDKPAKQTTGEKQTNTPAAEVSKAPETQAEKEKRCKALRKKLKQIEELKAKVEEKSSDQVAKIATESTVLAELDTLMKSMAT